MTTNTDQHPFQAEVRQLLNIVINSLYTDKEIFVRELVSNASDALEKLRHLQHTEKEIFDSQLGLEIQITTDDTAGTITISDFGIGMTREELIENLGTIAHSGSRKFFQALEESQQKESALIGQFGVGFYSVFMVAEEVKVYTHSWREEGGHLVWTSDGQSGYTIEEAPGQRRGCKIVARLREDCKEFAGAGRVEGILKKYSNFVPFPIHLNGKRINTVEALWMKPKAGVKEEEYEEFYKFVAKAWDKPRYQFHLSVDAPIAINSLLFVPGTNKEKLLGVGQVEPSVALYCKKVLIDPNPKGLLPEWLRFLSGVIDSADLPLNISRESMQDSQLVQKLNRVVTNRFLSFLHKRATADSGKYLEFFKDFSRFLKEGICTDSEHKEALAKLLRFESSLTNAGEFTGLDAYLTRMKEGQEEIYYLVGPNRKSIESGPYLEAFKARGLEVIFLFESIDDYMLGNLFEFGNKKLVPASRAGLDLGEAIDAGEEETLSEDDTRALCDFLKEHLGERVEDVSASKRLTESPAAALTPEDMMSAQMRRMFQAMSPDSPMEVKVNLEINPRHALIKRLAAVRESEPGLAQLVATQLFESTLMAAGLLDSEMPLVNRGYEIMAAALEK
jgi:molecular chaperone HtpG